RLDSLVRDHDGRAGVARRRGGNDPGGAGFDSARPPHDSEGCLIAVKTGFITGNSRGFGREWAIAALERGDRVAATARDLATQDELVAKYGDAILPIRLDVTDR